jgi:ASC-1-like (ASCH) protein
VLGDEIMNEDKAQAIAIRIFDEFEKLLEAKGIQIPSKDREGREEGACIYGAEYWHLEDTITGILVEEVFSVNDLLDDWRL